MKYDPTKTKSIPIQSLKSKNKETDKMYQTIWQYLYNQEKNAQEQQASSAF